VCEKQTEFKSLLTKNLKFCYIKTRAACTFCYK